MMFYAIREIKQIAHVWRNHPNVGVDFNEKAPHVPALLAHCASKILPVHTWDGRIWYWDPKPKFGRTEDLALDSPNSERSF
jgi:hypothetical protein